MENSLEVPQISKYSYLITQQLHIPKRNGNMFTRKNVFTNVHSNIIHNRKKDKKISQLKKNDKIHAMEY